MSDAAKGKKARIAERKGDPSVQETQRRLGMRIKALRAERGLTQGRLAEGAGMSQKYLGEVERGIRNISLEAVTVIANTLDVSTAALLENDHEQPKDVLLAEVGEMVKLLAEEGVAADKVRLVYRLLKVVTER